jgi:1,4-alpha-glucan branching enzyme
VRQLNRVYRTTAALHEIDYEPAGFEWIDCEDAARSLVSFVRRGRTRRDLVVVAANWTPVPRSDYRLGVPEPGRYRVLLDSDAPRWGGSGAGPQRMLRATAVAAHGRPQSVVMTLPPLAVVYLVPVHAS